MTALDRWLGPGGVPVVLAGGGVTGLASLAIARLPSDPLVRALAWIGVVGVGVGGMALWPRLETNGGEK